MLIWFQNSNSYTIRYIGNNHFKYFLISFVMYSCKYICMNEVNEKMSYKVLESIVWLEQPKLDKYFWKLLWVDLSIIAMLGLIWNLRTESRYFQSIQL